MRDPRLDRLANQVIGYSVRLQPGESVLIDAWDGAEEFAVALVEAAQRAGGRPQVELQSMRVNRALMRGVTEEGMADWYAYERARMERMDAYIAIRRQENAYEYADVDPARMEIYNRYSARLHNGLRIPHTKWCVLRYPNGAAAQQSRMSTEAFEDYYFKACCVDYGRLNEIACALNRYANRADWVHIIAPDTDLRFSIKGQCQPESLCGIWNLPCGETGMQIVQGTANGHIHYNIPSNYQGTVFEDVRLTLRDGRIVEAEANYAARLNEILNTDANARRIGEFSIGFNPFITEPILDTLFDEKMTGSLHFTPGNSQNNPSAIHWDLVQSHLPAYGGGEIWFDDILIRKDGLFVPEDLQVMNPDRLSELIAKQ